MHLDNVKVTMKLKYTVKDKLTLIFLAAGVLIFGVVLPDSFSDHDKLLHFAAHFGMSFLLALSFYFFCVIALRATKRSAYMVLVLATLSIGVLYKLWEIAPLDMLSRYSFSRTVEITGAMTSMSQNLSGMMAAMLLIEGLIDRNMIMSLLRSGRFHVGPVRFYPTRLKQASPDEKRSDPQNKHIGTSHQLSSPVLEN
jgi:hypothetical protein